MGKKNAEVKMVMQYFSASKEALYIIVYICFICFFYLTLIALKNIFVDIDQKHAL